MGSLATARAAQFTRDFVEFLCQKMLLSGAPFGYICAMNKLFWRAVTTTHITWFGLASSLCLAAVVALSLIAPSAPVSYAEAVQITLVHHGITTSDVQINLCPAGPTACYRQIVATVRVTTDRPINGFFSCAHENGDCRLSVRELDLVGAPMPDTVAAGSLTHHIRYALAYRWAQTRALVGARFPSLFARIHDRLP